MAQDEALMLLAATKTEPAKLAGSICWQLRDHGKATMRAIGAGAVNQSVKAIILANQYLSANGKRLDARPFFLDLEIDDRDHEVTAIEWRITEIAL